MFKRVILNNGIDSLPYFTTTFYSVPIGNHILHQVIFRSFASRCGKVFYRYTTLPRHTKALTFMLASAFACYLSITLSYKWIVGSHIQFQLVFRSSIITSKVESVPQNPFCLPYLHITIATQLLRKTGRVSSGSKSFISKYRRGSMMPMTCPFISRKTGNNYIGLKFSDHPNHITQYLFFVPEKKGFISFFTIAKIISTAKKLFSSIYSSGRQQFLCSYQSQFHTLLIANQVLSSIATGKAQITCPIQFFLSQISQQPRIFIIRMGSYVQHACKHIQLFQLKVNIRTTIRCRCLSITIRTNHYKYKK